MPPTFFEYTDDDGDNLRVSEHADGYYFTVAMRGQIVTAILPTAAAQNLASKLVTHLVDGVITPRSHTEEAEACERCANHDPRDRRDHGHLPASFTAEVESDTVLTVEQQQRQEAIWAARAAVNNDASGMFSKGAKVEDVRQLLAAAYFVATGDRDYLLTDGERVDHYGEGDDAIAQQLANVQQTLDRYWEERGFQPVDPDSLGH